jgi:hypothetical protein
LRVTYTEEAVADIVEAIWSADGRFLYYTPTGTNLLVRSAVCARPFASASGPHEGEPIAVYASTEMLMPRTFQAPRQSPRPIKSSSCSATSGATSG